MRFLSPHTHLLGEEQFQIDRQPWHFPDDQIDRGAALERERAVRKDEGRDLDQQAGGVELGLVHGLSTRNPSAERDTQTPALPVGSCAGSSFAAQGSESSRPNCKHRRRVGHLLRLPGAYLFDDGARASYKCVCETFHCVGRGTLP